MGVLGKMEVEVDIKSSGDVFHELFDGEKCEAKVIVEAIDEKNKLVRFKIIEGSLLKEYKSFVATLEVVHRGAITAVKWAVDFEKFEDFGPYPVKLMDFIIGMTRDIEAHHLKE
uniref:Bet v I/Major latex protein domain-containing protein n=1 Tax=Chenopodium quinoa TaxID=63459 RepID=A0A803L6J2_CHEQI